MLRHVKTRTQDLVASLRQRQDGNATPEELAYARKAITELDDQKARNTIPIGLAFNIVIVLCCHLILPLEGRIPLYMLSGLLIVFDLLWIFGLKRWIRAEWVIVFGNFAMVAMFCHTLVTSTQFGREGLYMIGSSIIATFSAILVMLCPFSNWRSPAMAAGYWLIAWQFFPERAGTRIWLFVYAITLIFASVIRQVEALRRQRETIFELRARQADIRAAEARHTRDLELARDIQDSMAPPPRQSTPEGLVISCLQQKHERIAGDWMTVRRFADGRVALVVVDATGKGIQAALVVHAIQSLWATTLDREDLDPAAWLESVHVALRRLGEKQPHSATIGIALLDGRRITYWSAGHLPLFLLLGKDPSRTFRTLNSRGNIVGLAASLDLKPHYIDIDPLYPVRLLMASDGVFERGTMTTQGAVEALYDELCARGAEALAAVATVDDKSLIIVERNVEGAQLRMAG